MAGDPGTIPWQSSLCALGELPLHSLDQMLLPSSSLLQLDPPAALGVAHAIASHSSHDYAQHHLQGNGRHLGIAINGHGFHAPHSAFFAAHLLILNLIIDVLSFLGFL